MRKRKIAVLLLVLLFSLTGCMKQEPEPEPLRVYSFCGENELFSVRNGVIVISDSQEIFSGGDLKLRGDGFDDICSFERTFYIMPGNMKKILLSGTVTDMTGGTVSMEGSLGQVSGGSVVSGTQIEDLRDLKNNLFLEIITVSLDGEQNTYQLQMQVTEVT